MIKKLPASISNKIAAGEVVERPAAVVKELIENSLDAAATEITINIKGAGKSLIEVTDNGSGIAKSDLAMLFERHATSKISQLSDIDHIASLGFRGEALASIAAVSRVSLTSKVPGQMHAYHLRRQAEKQSALEAVAGNDGTSIAIRDLFYNTPARYKFLKSDRAEETAIVDVVKHMMLSRPDIVFKLVINQKILYKTSGNNKLSEIIYQLYGRSIIDHLLPLSITSKDLTIRGYITDSHYTRGTRRFQTLFVNSRYVKNDRLQEAVNSAYKMLTTIGKFAVFVIHITLPYDEVDINVHPAKTEIKFKDSQRLENAVKQAVTDTLAKYSLVAKAKLSEQTDLPVSLQAQRDSDALNRYFEDFVAQREQSDSFMPALVSNSDLLDAEGQMSTLPNSEQADQTAERSSVDQAAAWEEAKLARELFSDQTAEYRAEQIDLADRLSYRATLYDNLMITGVLFGTYIICQRDYSAFIIDQHAAHERVLYEKFIAQFASQTVASQQLLEPYIYHTEAHTDTIIAQSVTKLRRMGIEIEPFGKYSWLIRAVPLIKELPFSKQSVTVLLDRLIESGDDLLTEIVRNDLIRAACRAAVKAHDPLTNSEIHALFEALSNYQNPYTCPHGRPIIIELTEYELEKKFKRIQ